MAPSSRQMIDEVVEQHRQEEPEQHRTWTETPEILYFVDAQPMDADLPHK